MIARARLTLDERYYRAFYPDWVRYRSRLRKFAPLFAAVPLLAGCLLLCFSKRPHAGIVFLLIGIAYVIDVLTYGRRWTQRRMKAGGSTSMQIEFYDDRIFIRTDRGEGYHRLPGFVEVTPADHGIFLYPQKGILYYIPWDSIEPADALAKIRELLVSRGKIGS